MAAELGVPDLLADGPKRSDELAIAVGAHPPALERLLRALTTIDVCRHRDDGSFELTPMGRLLCSDVDGSVRSWTIYWGRDLWPVWGRLIDSVKTGESARKLELGVVDFEHVERDPDMAARFNRAMVELTRLAARSVVEQYDFSAMKVVVDVGGGYGELLAAILSANPALKGVLLDLPHAVEAAPGHLRNAGVLDRCDIVGGSFFEHVPAGGDGYVLKSVIHDWNDERSAEILRNCRQAMSDGAKLLLVERIVRSSCRPRRNIRGLSAATSTCSSLSAPRSARNPSTGPCCARRAST